MSVSFQDAAAEAQLMVGTDGVEAMAEGIGAGWSRASMLALRSLPGFTEAVTAVSEAIVADAVPAAEAAAYLRGLAAGHALRVREQQVSLVWSGPKSHRVPVRSTGRVLLQIVEEAQQELVMMTYSARRYPPLTQALQAAIARGVSVDVVVETLQGAGSALAGTEPASVFAEVEGLRVWHWPPGSRTEVGAKTHAKLALADRRVLLTTSANFTQSGVDRNIEAGILIRGGSVPERTSEHIHELQRTGVLARYW